MLTEGLRDSVAQMLGADIVESKRVSGGSINNAVKIETRQKSYFMKWNSDSRAEDMFNKEAKGLHLLEDAGTDLLIPEIMGTGYDEQSGICYLVMEYLEQDRSGPKKQSAQKFGYNLAQLHQNSNEQFGLDYDNYIGSLPQKNTFRDDWISFFVEMRLEPLVQKAIDAGLLSGSDQAQFSALYPMLSDIMPNEKPALLHGDLWSGNYFYCGQGKTAIYDPAVYYGHREIELAFTRLFGGFSADFYKAYEESFPLEPGFNDRYQYYNLYPLLVHVNLFGGSYVGQVRSIIRKI